ncbi:MAG TPA: hypothetical protein VEC12_00195 [Bacteroidia bacterium]|nr:hypothetical protein [Bacteroidia bacterium]
MNYDITAAVVEVFKTNVKYTVQAEKLVAALKQHFNGARINFDLEDRDKILRLEGENINAGTVAEIMRKNGFNCEVLE